MTPNLRTAFPPLGSWEAEAACKGEDPAIFTSQRHVDRDHAVNLERAVAICRSCPVRMPCLEYAVKHRPAGVWGGVPEEDRRKSDRNAKRRAQTAQQTRQLVCPGCLSTSVSGGICGRCGSRVGPPG